MAIHLATSIKCFFFTRISPKKIFDFLRDTLKCPSPWFLQCCVSSLKKLYRTVLTPNKEADLQPTLNKGVGGSSLVIFFTNIKCLGVMNQHQSMELENLIEKKLIESKKITKTLELSCNTGKLVFLFTISRVSKILYPKWDTAASFKKPYFNL